MSDIKTIHIEKGTGYIWMSDASSPRVYQNESVDLFFETIENPFVIEGNVTDGIVSYSIRFVDGHYIVRQYDLHKDAEYSEQVYLPHRMPNVKGLRFRRYWRAEEDIMCEGMKVLQPKELVFVGFEDKEEEL